MYDLRSRVLALTTVMMMSLVATALLMGAMSYVGTYLVPPRPVAHINAVVRETMATTVVSGVVMDRAMVALNGTADLSACFNWNTKLIYLFAVVEYATPTYSRNEVTIYDTILPNREAARNLRFPSLAKYHCDHAGSGGLLGRSAVLRLRYHAMDYSGLSQIHEVADAAAHFTFPSQYDAPGLERERRRPPGTVSLS